MSSYDAPDGSALQESMLDMSDAASIASSEHHTTWTEEVEHEPFSSIKTKVLRLCETTWPELAEGVFRVVQMEGGSYNCVSGCATQAIYSVRTIHKALASASILIYELGKVESRLRLLHSTIRTCLARARSRNPLVPSKCKGSFANDRELQSKF
jgi:hypothetical protein